ncbi:hypothetical protein CA2015_2870 [Cyclobacterium amurskyense]|uniref:Outer membrane protein beta-barrel domain-containing protein n=2 Tax=Cyclobacterium amurskyense TaxID=320787 RepID=A0A0H4PV78_9BACT|nr:hypothetical protein CA2015_2870 [Cyclobacterium amurskyense]|tara:strand:+ start:10545 stop:11123 length:579 start_codon:yes stop_codon:yes gene_type:complete
MKKTLLLAAIALVFIALPKVSLGQVSFSHSLGAAYYVSTSTIITEYSESTSTIGSPAILYSPRINVVELGEEMTVSVGTHLGLGFSADTSTGSASFALDLPVVAEINFGHGAHADTRSSVGGYAGVGYGINRLGGGSDFDGVSTNKASGPVLNGGVRALINGIPVGLRVSYLLNMEEGGNVAGIGAFYTFGF